MFSGVMIQLHAKNQKNSNPAGIYLLKVNNKNTRTPDANVVVMVSLLLTLNIFHTFFIQESWTDRIHFPEFKTPLPKVWVFRKSNSFSSHFIFFLPALLALSHNGNTRIMCKICSKLTIKTQEIKKIKELIKPTIQIVKTFLSPSQFYVRLIIKKLPT